MVPFTDSIALKNTRLPNATGCKILFDIPVLSTIAIALSVIRDSLSNDCPTTLDAKQQSKISDIWIEYLTCFKIVT